MIKHMMYEAAKKYKREDLFAALMSGKMNERIAREVGVGDGKDWTPPAHEKKKLTTKNALAAAKSVVAKLMGNVAGDAKNASDGENEKKEKVQEEEEESEMVFEEYPVETQGSPDCFQGDSTIERTWVRIKETIVELRQHGATRVHVVTSPPWGVLHGKTGEGEEDNPLTPTQIGMVK